MHYIDIIVLSLYFLIILWIGFFYFRKNKDTEAYYVGDRKMGSLHIGLSVVATDVGGGFSIGLGGLGFMMGLSGSWMLFTGLMGAWLSATLLIPKIFDKSRLAKMLTFPQLLGSFYDKRVALLAGLISGIGYLGFTSSQLLAGAKLATATFPVLSISEGLLIMGVIAVVYTTFGGLKAVIYTDTFQWAILILGLSLVGIPAGYLAIGGWDAMSTMLPERFLSLGNISAVQAINWVITIVPIWFIGMTLYQRIYACRDLKTAKRAWYLAGLFEYPVMAFMGVLLGLFARVGAEQGLFEAVGYSSAAGMDPELGLPLLLRNVLPIGVMGLLLAAYFSAIMSTADSCLMAASGNVITDIFGLTEGRKVSQKSQMRVSQIVTLLLGSAAILLASQMQNVLELMLYSYAFMVSGLFIPVLGFLFYRTPPRTAAFWSMLLGGTTTLSLTALPQALPWGLDPIFFGIVIGGLTFLLIRTFKKG